MAFGDIVLLRDKTPLGPFTRAEIQEGLTRGEFRPRDLAHTPGLRDWLPLLEVLHYLDRDVVNWPRTGETGHLPPLSGQTAAPKPVDISPVYLSTTPPVDRPFIASIPSLAARSVPLAGSGPEKSGPPVLPARPASDEVEKSPRRNPPPLQPMPDSAEGVAPPNLAPAPLSKRAMAFLIDVGILFLPILAVYGFAYGIGQIRGSIEHRTLEEAREDQALLWQHLRDLVLLVANGLAWIYAAGLESSHWQGTVGKQTMGLIVTDRSGARISFLRATGRHGAKYLSALPCFLGFMAALFGPQRLAWHDRLAGTWVAKRTNPR
jgi:uncharacterized RDD family membrane protein YckC